MDTPIVLRMRAYMRSAVVAASTLLSVVTAVRNGVGETPAMGWSSWNQFRCDIDEAMLREVARSLVSTGLRDAGYRYLNVDDCWQTRRGPDGHIVPDAQKFPCRQLLRPG